MVETLPIALDYWAVWAVILLLIVIHQPYLSLVSVFRDGYPPHEIPLPVDVFETPYLCGVNSFHSGLQDVTNLSPLPSVFCTLNVCLNNLALFSVPFFQICIIHVLQL